MQEELFWSKVDRRENGCWEWTKATSGGYGRCYDPATRKQILAHRQAWIFTNGPISPGSCVLHHCDNPPCCNPSHLWLGTRGDNARDASKKGRMGNNRGERNGRAKLTAEKVQQIRRLYSTGRTKMSLSREFGVAGPQIYYIVTHKTWKHVP